MSKEDNNEKEKKSTGKSLPEKLSKSKDEKKNIEPEVYEGLPEEVKNVMEIGMSMQRYSGQLPSPIASKINEKHIDKILDLAKDDSQNEFKNKKANRRYTLFYILIFVALFAFLTVFLLPETKEVYIDILKILVVFAGGLGSGYGLKTLKDKKEKD